MLFPGIQLTLEIQSTCGTTLKEFKAKVAEDPKVQDKITSLRTQVENFAQSFKMPGLDEL